jgi:hypothetical protein
MQRSRGRADFEVNVARADPLMRTVRQRKGKYMNHLSKFVRLAIPTPIKRRFRAIHRDFVFRRAVRRFIRNPESCAHPGNPVLVDLIYGWGNESWSSLDEYLVACIRHVLGSSEPTLECGSGLSTILVGFIAKKRGQSHWALEHSPEWAMRVQRFLKKYKLDSAVVVCANPLRDYGDYSWYDPPLESMPGVFDVVICDGPPGTTKGGRYGLVPIMKERFKPGCIILLDDADREEERTIAERWKTELGASFEICGSSKSYIKMTVLDT